MAVWIGLLAVSAKPSGAQGVWNDARTRALVELATHRRAEQLADTGLVDYRANARGYVTLLASFGDGFLDRPKVVKTDELALEVYWHAPNLSKQRIIGRRDTLLMPTDIQYHRDHLGIVQNNFPDFIRIGEGDEVRDVPHPLSPGGLALYDFQLSGDSVRIGLSDRTINLLEVRVRPKDDRQARVIGAIFIDPNGGQVVRMAFNFTRAAFLDGDLEDLAVVLENRLIAQRYWLPSRQEIEIRRTGTWLDYPVRGIIRGRWEIGDYQFNLSTPTQVFAGPEIVIAPPQELKKYPWTGTIMDSLPPDVRETVDPDIQRVLTDARVMVRAQALQRVQTFRLSAPRASDFVRVNRVEGLAVGTGVTTKLAPGVLLITRGRYGIDDRQVKGTGALRWQRPSGSFVEAFGSRENVDIGDVAERSTVVNSFAAQEFGSDMTDPYQATSLGVRGGLGLGSFNLGLSVAREGDQSVATNASPETGRYLQTPAITPLLKMHGFRAGFSAYRPRGDWAGPGQLALGGRLGFLVSVPLTDVAASFPPAASTNTQGLRASLWFDDRLALNSSTLIVSEQVAAIRTHYLEPLQDLIYYGGPVSAPGYSLHSIGGTMGSATRVELQVPTPFIAIPLGRFGRIPGLAHLAPFVSAAVVRGTVACTATIVARCPTLTGGLYPSAGLGLLTIFDMLRFDVARGLRNGRWMFNVDVNRDFWSIL
jgi:hypothetical protein